ncbi:MAG: antibiotic biosynthesis monooxygenase [Bacteroidetes bacterium]|nr:antibiotic biosynthesis monooxygenase [Bacteroidota bacterium]MBP7399036.1 antibiotic biosynthesis monooxygenase [Chitinophagales bacterium]MBK7109004.1 antibiotic biosynthesis monooxygenase [Bacteroidota bacterium]MBK8488673.1 antibiotic biosynthesis monooxygenase [Bacteroidota bacterium]MBK8681566.1 antibiotic biosynthesis monooxygenase [Bacteroidota bacterium]
MITRIVKMSFDTDKIETFIEIFANAKSKIAAFPGCSGVTLYRDILHSHLFFTYSEWESADALEEYRQSLLFKETWAKTKILFNEKPQAWSIQKVMQG